MSGKLTREAYEKLINEDKEYLGGLLNGRQTLESRHIIDVLDFSVRAIYDVEPEHARLKGALERDVANLRTTLWLRHDERHTGVLYGDDGEMQCAACLIDFKHMDTGKISAAFQRIGMERLAIAQKSEREVARAVIVHVVSRGWCWLMKRKPPLIFSDMWATPGGHIEPGETALEAAVRETKEEMAIEADALRFIPFGPPSHHVRPNGTKSILEYFVLELKVGEIPRCTEPTKHTPWELFNFHSPPSPVTPGTEIAIGRALTWRRP